MKIKTYIEANKLDALLKIRDEMGPDAVIVSEKEVKGKGLLSAFAKPKVEIVAALREKPVTAVVSMTSRKALLDDEVEEVRERLRSERETRSAESSEKIGKLESELSQLREQISVLAQNGVAVVNSPVVEQPEPVGNPTSVNLNDVLLSGPIQPSPRPPRVVALVGPTGVGKTTTIAKLAAEYALIQRRKVGLITLDTFRIAAVEQIRTYAQIMDIPLEIATTPEDVKTALNAYSNLDFVFIDTVGRSQKSSLHLEEMRTALEAANPEVHLVLSMTTKDSDLDDIVSRFSVIPIHRLLFTKLDETDSSASIAEISQKFRLPISYFTNGQRVPEDIEVASRERLSQLMSLVSV